MGPIRPLIAPGYEGNCSICGLFLTKKFPEGYPDEWKFCCICLLIAKEIVTETLEKGTWSEQVVGIIRNKITLMGNNGTNKTNTKAR